MKRNQTGFTLIELMIVIAIIAILMAYALPAYRDYTIRTKLGEGNAMAAAVKLSVNEAFVRVGALGGLNSGANGIGAANEFVGDCVSGIATAAGVITVSYNCATGSAGQADPVVDASTITWTPTPAGNSGQGLQWVCAPSANLTASQDPC